MDIAKLTSKGQLTLPVSIRKKMELQTGDQVAFIEKNGEFVMVAAHRLHVESQRCNSDGVIASLAFEDLIVNEDMKLYAKDRISGNVSYEAERQRLICKYKQVANNNG